MLDVAKSLPDDPDELRRFTALLLAEVKSQAMLIEKLRHQLAGHRSHRFGTSSETIEQLQLALEATEISIAKMTAKLRLPDEEGKDKPKRRPIPDHIPRQEIELTTGDEDCARCGGTLRRLGEDVTEELEFVPGARPLFLNQWRTRSRHREPDRPSPPGLFRLRGLHTGRLAIPPDRARPSRPRPAGACSGLQIRRPSAALSPEPDLRARRTRPRPLDARGLGRQVHGASGTARRCHRAACAGRPGDLRGRHPGQDAGARHRQDRDCAAVDIRAGRAALGRRCPARQLVSLLARSEGPTPQGSSRRLQRLDACRWLRRVRGHLSVQRHPRGRLHGTRHCPRTNGGQWLVPAQVRRRPQGPGIGHRRRGHPAHRAALRGREGGAGIAAGPACRDPPGESGAGLRRIGQLAARPTADDLRQVTAGHGDPIWPDAHEAASTLSRPRLPRAGHG